MRRIGMRVKLSWSGAACCWRSRTSDTDMRHEERYSHRVCSPAAVALLSDDRCAEVLGVGERESVECLHRTQTKKEC